MKAAVGSGPFAVVNTDKFGSVIVKRFKTEAAAQRYADSRNQPRTSHIGRTVYPSGFFKVEHQGNPAKRYEGKFALYTDSGLRAFGVTRKRAVSMAKKITVGSAKVATTSGTVLETYVKGRKQNPAAAKTVTLHNFSGTVKRLSNGQVLVKGRQR